MRKNTSRVEIIITISDSIENCMKNMSKIFVALFIRLKQIKSTVAKTLGGQT